MILRLKTRESRSPPGLPMASYLSSFNAPSSFKKPRRIRVGAFCVPAPCRAALRRRFCGLSRQRGHRRAGPLTAASPENEHRGSAAARLAGPPTKRARSQGLPAALPGQGADGQGCGLPDGVRLLGRSGACLAALRLERAREGPPALRGGFREPRGASRPRGLDARRASCRAAVVPGPSAGAGRPDRPRPSLRGTVPPGLAGKPCRRGMPPPRRAASPPPCCRAHRPWHAGV